MNHSSSVTSKKVHYNKHKKHVRRWLFHTQRPRLTLHTLWPSSSRYLTFYSWWDPCDRHSTVHLRIPVCTKQGWHTVRVVVKWIHCTSTREVHVSSLLVPPTISGTNYTCSPVRYSWFKTQTEDNHLLTPNFSWPSRGRLVQGFSSKDPCIQGRLPRCERKSVPVFHLVSYGLCIVPYPQTVRYTTERTWWSSLTTYVRYRRGRPGRTALVDLSNTLEHINLTGLGIRLVVLSGPMHLFFFKSCSLYIKDKSKVGTGRVRHRTLQHHSDEQTRDHQHRGHQGSGRVQHLQPPRDTQDGCLRPDACEARIVRCSH